MSTHTDTAPRHASPTEPTLESDAEATPTSDDEPSPNPSYDAHDAAATFDTGSTVRLPNTVDCENKRVG
ncbi:hypothetical protein SAMN05216559_1656 [Halomicrobium zhouii]|uniref:Uncharacterized protein n=1 Tax=Halomicrobium zhouii TaxID=767519 RepID=A0A1I6KZG3_9EURY|nr:hypothetical protein [Halomicrobium zhouii]SFR96601.1 hypothetical protein SAMN05216559_1656 [Halomicrobium zhouii]